jgi:hypothetical protein
MPEAIESPSPSGHPGGFVMPEYRVVGNSFHLGRGGLKDKFQGPVVASRDAIYFVIDETPSESAIASFGGSIGALIVLGMARRRKRQHDARQFDYAEVPQQITAHPDWPLKREEGPVIVVPRELVERTRYGRFSTYELECDDRLYRICLNTLLPSKAIRFLSDAGWDSKLAADRPPPMAWMPPLVGLCVGTATGAVAGTLSKPPGAPSSYVPLLAATGAILGFLAGVVVRGLCPRK